MTVSVVIPTLNEAGCVEDTLRHVNRLDPAEVVVADGDSLDGTPEIAEQYATVVRAERGRAAQMNAGADATSGDVLLFLHADTRLPEDGLAHIREALQDPSVEGGAFRLRFDAETPLLQFYSLCTAFPLPHICFGDRAHFVRRSVFEAIGGFPDVPIFEDLELAQRLHKRGGFVYLNSSVVTSARRYERNGPLLQQLRNAALWLGYFSGVQPRRLERFYDYTT